MQDEIFDLLLKEEELSWKNILYDLVESEKMDPWDVNITLLTQKYIQVIKEMKEHDLRVSGKIILAAAILLKIKSTHLIENDISRLDRMLQQDSDLDSIEMELSDAIDVQQKKEKEKFPLLPRNPQARNRKVSIHDLVSALQHALETKKKILAKIKPVKFNMPTRKVDIMEVIRDVYHKLQYYSEKDGGSITFTRLLPPRAGREEKVFTFIPLLHLENQHKVAMEQEKPFEEISVTLLKKKMVKQSS